MKDDKDRSSTRPDDAGGPITALQAVSYTALLGLIAAVASGWFDAMIPWGTP